MPSILYLSHNDVIKCQAASLEMILGIIKHVFICHYNKDFILPHKVVLRWGGLETENTLGRINSMPAFIGGDIRALGLKWIGSFPLNRQKGIPRATAIIILNDTGTGLPIAIMEGAYISAMRTTAVNLLAAEYLCSCDSQTIAIIGTGIQNRFQLNGFLSKFSSLKKINIFNRTHGRVKPFIKLFRKFKRNIQVFNSVAETVKDADIVLTATTTDEPLIKKENLKNGVTYFHFSGNECEYEVVNEFDKIYVDDWDVILHRGNLTPAKMYHEGLLNDDRIIGNLGQILNRKIPFRQSNSENIMFCAMGMAIEDIAVASAIYREAKEKNIGFQLSLWDQLDPMLEENERDFL